MKSYAVKYTKTDGTAATTIVRTATPELARLKVLTEPQFECNDNHDVTVEDATPPKEVKPYPRTEEWIRGRQPDDTEFEYGKWQDEEENED